MKRTIVMKTAVAIAVIALSAALGTSSAQCAEKEKGEALKQLEAAAGKKIEDVKVPDVPKPTPVGSSYEVNTSTSSYEVNTSTTSSQGTKP